MGQKKLEVQKGLESALCVLAVNFMWANCQVDDSMVMETIAHFKRAGVNVTPDQILEALEEVATNNNEYGVLGVSDPDNEDMEEGQ